MNTKSMYVFLFVLLASILAACGAPASTATDPLTIAQGFWDAINAKNVDVAMAFVADDVVIRGGLNPLSGKTELSAFMSSELEKGMTFEISDLVLSSEDEVTYTMKVYTKKGTKLVSSPFLRIQVKDGKIVLVEFPL
jgi:ketosteroid isomerase-like protein